MFLLYNFVVLTLLEDAGRFLYGGSSQILEHRN